MIDKDTFKKAIAKPFKQAGFIKKGLSWYLDGRDALIVFNLQRSDWGARYYLNMGIWLKAFGEAIFPKYNHCPLDFRVERFFPERRELILLGCSLEESNLPLLADLTEFIESELIPFLQACTDESKLRELVAQGAHKKGKLKLKRECI